MSLIYNFYNSIMEKSDKRLADWPLMSSPLSTITICLTYVYFVKHLGPKLMKNRPPFQLRGLMIAYNFIMVLISALLVYFYGISGWFTHYSYKCQPVDYSNSPDALLMAKTSYFYFIVKFVEFFDTLFFVLRKKYDHITTLHVIHHGIMPFSVWWGVKFVPGGHATFFSTLNSFIHIIMYTYYGLAAIGPHMNKYLTWKKYLTSMQMVQFVLIFTHSFQLIFRQCNFPKAFMVWIGCHGILFWFLFKDFYNKTYTNNNNNNIAAAKKDGKSLSSSYSTTTSPNHHHQSFTNGAIKTSNDSIEKLKHAIEKRLN